LLSKYFEDKAEAGMTYIGKIFKEPLGCPIEEILKVINPFPKVFNEEMNDSI